MKFFDGNMNRQALMLVSNVEADGTSLSELYLRRYNIEFDIRDFKVTLNT